MNLKPDLNIIGLNLLARNPILLLLVLIGNK